MLKNLPNTTCRKTEALIIFLKYPEPGHVKTRLAASIGTINAAKVYQKMAERVITGLEDDASELRTVIFFDPPEAADKVRKWLQPFKTNLLLMPQTAGGLGQKMADAFNRTFAIRDTQKIVIIGTDCPAVDVAIIRDAYNALEHYSAVIGPALDGGYYLLGLNTEIPWLFEDIPWSTPQVLAQTLRQLEMHQMSYRLLPELQDIDTGDDLQTLWPDWGKDIG